VWTLCLMLGLLASAFPAWAAEIVEVRIGRHPEFTRVVFELDRAAGYRIERSDPSNGVAELIVSLEAASIPRNINSSKSLIENVDVAPAGSRSIARVRLAKDGLRLKEMILTNPPRIVLDVLKEPTPAVARTTSPKPEKPSARDEEAFDEVVAQIPVEPTPRPEAARPPAFVREVDPMPVVEPEPAPIAAAEAVREEAAQDEAEVFFEDDPQMAADEPSTSIPMDEPEAVQEVADAAPAPMPVPAPTAKPTPRPMVAKSTTSADEGGGFMMWALVGVGAIVLLLGGVFMARRRGASDEGDDDAEDYIEDHDDAPASYAEASAADENPFSGLSDDAETDATLGAPDAVTVEPMMNDEDATIAFSPQGLAPDEEKESESVVFDETEETVMDDMDVISREQVNESLGGAMPPAMGAAIPEEFQQMVMEMNRRMEALESRCDELVDARDRLERQVAAQTEELRVQRAAIARTQRAVRNLGRPEGEEQEATEPALRDPNLPSSE
jgi:hypothetical protein